MGGGQWELKKTNLNPRNELRKDEPHIDHLHVSGAGQSRRHTDEQGGQDQESGQVHRHDRFEEELLEEVGCVHDAEHQDGRQVDCEDRVHDSPTKYKRHGEASGRVAFVDIIQSPVFYDVLRENCLGLHPQRVRHNLHNLSLQLSHHQFHRAYLAF